MNTIIIEYHCVNQLKYKISHHISQKESISLKKKFFFSYPSSSVTVTLRFDSQTQFLNFCLKLTDGNVSGVKIEKCEELFCLLLIISKISAIKGLPPSGIISVDLEFGIIISLFTSTLVFVEQIFIFE